MSTTGLSRLYQYMTREKIEVTHATDEELLAGIGRQLQAEMIEATPELLEILDQIEAEQTGDTSTGGK